MASTIFILRSKNLSAGHAFELEQRKALAEYGADARCGTIARKSAYEVLTKNILSPEAATSFAKEVLNGGETHQHINTEDGPCGVIRIGRLEWLIFGRARA